MPWQLSLVNNKFLLFKFIISHWFISWAKLGRSAITVLFNNWKALSKGWNKHYFYLKLLNQNINYSLWKFPMRIIPSSPPPQTTPPSWVSWNMLRFLQLKICSWCYCYKTFQLKNASGIDIKKTPFSNLTPYQSIHFILCT